jgi:L-seryl-tRNA(Ser) seleniumtransferase
MVQTDQELLRKLPAIDKLLQSQELQALAAAVPRRVMVEAVRAATDEVREQIRAAADSQAFHGDPKAAILERAQERIRQAMGPYYRRVINATGIVLHTALGRAVLPARALRQIQEQFAGYSLLQMDLATGERSNRDARIAWLLQQLTGAEAATVVNNNAAATALVLNTLAAGREVIVSRGQLVEIGGSFRLPEVMAASGVRLVEVGTTNKTHPADYERAINENTAAILRVHPSNYRIVGFTAEVPPAELAALAHAHRLPLIDDVGAGALMDFSRFGFEYEPTLADSIQAGADVVLCSGDKLIGATQAGIILGRGELVRAMRQNPWARILRIDKMSLAVLEATLTLFLDEELALREVPTLVMLRRGPAELGAMADRLAAALRAANMPADIEVQDGFSEMGGGSLPGQSLPTRLVAVRPQTMSVDELARRLRLHEPPVIARIQGQRVLFDPRTLQSGEEEIVVAALAAVCRA